MIESVAEFHIDLAERFEHLSGAPIVEAVIDIRARAEVQLEESSLLSELRPKLLSDYPKIESQQQIRQEFKLGPGTLPEAGTRDLGWKGLRFRSADDLHMTQFNRDGFVFSRFQPYDTWEQLHTEAMRLWHLYLAAAKIAAIHRIGLRFVNRFAIPRDDLCFENYLQPAPVPPRGLDLPFFGFFHQDTLGVPGHDFGINVIRTIQPAADPLTEGMRLILDIDVFTIKPFEIEAKDLDHCLLEMRWLKNKVFFGTVTEKALAMFRQTKK